MRWSWEGFFSLDMPDDWSVNQSNEIIEFRPPVQSGAVHISVLRRTAAGHVREGEARRLLEEFASLQQGDGLSVSEEACAGGRVAHGSFRSEGDGVALFWEAQTIVWVAYVLRCSLCYDGKNDELRRQALEVFRTIEPAGGWLKDDVGRLPFEGSLKKI